MSDLIAVIIAGVAQGAPLFLVASGLTLIFGVMRVLNFAHGALFMLGAMIMTSALGGAQRGILIFVGGLLVSALFVAAVTAVSEISVFRLLQGRDHLLTLLASFGLLLFLEGAAQHVWGGGSRSQRAPFGLDGAVTIFGNQVPGYQLLLVAVGLLFAAMLWWLISNTPFGRRVQAVAQDRTMAQAMGINVRLIEVAVFALGGALAGMAGALMTPLVAVNVSLTTNFVIASFAIVVVGGMGSVNGTLVAAMLVGVLQSLSVEYAPGFAGFSLYAVVALVLLIRPQGIFGPKTLIGEAR